MLSKGSFSEASPLVAELVRGQDKARFPDWLEALESLLHDLYLAKVAPQRMSQVDVARQVSALAGDCTRERVVRAISLVRRIRIDLQRNINRQIALESMFLALASPP
jgi:DNA polymerase III gamma/tau subunit